MSPSGRDFHIIYAQAEARVSLQQDESDLKSISGFWMTSFPLCVIANEVVGSTRTAAKRDTRANLLG